MFHVHLSFELLSFSLWSLSVFPYKTLTYSTRSSSLYDTRVCTRYVKHLVYVIVLLVAIHKIMHIFDPNLSCPLSAIHVQHHTLMDIFDPNLTSVVRYQPFAYNLSENMYNATHFVLSSYTYLSVFS
jgi:hypothetical protein